MSAHISEIPAGLPAIKPKKPVNRVVTRKTPYRTYLEAFYKGKESLLAEYNRLKLWGIFGHADARRVTEEEAMKAADALYEKYKQEAEAGYRALRGAEAEESRDQVQSVLGQA